MSPVRHIKAVKIAVGVLLGALILIYAGGLILGVTAKVSMTLISVLEFIGAVSIPMAAGSVLLWFGYKFFLEPMIRQRKLDRIREYRARRDAAHLDEKPPT